ncbi:uncharacterized protein V6R79_000635 [Siganus canaliculatus]
MDQDQVQPGSAASSNKFVLCMIPESWALLPVHSPHYTPPRDSVAIYRRRPFNTLAYEGFICPQMFEKLPLLQLQPPLKDEDVSEGSTEPAAMSRAEGDAPEKLTADFQWQQEWDWMSGVTSDLPSYDEVFADLEQKLEVEAGASGDGETYRERPLEVASRETRDELTPCSELLQFLNSVSVNL